jgi:peptide/nickel transport system permease protein
VLVTTYIIRRLIQAIIVLFLLTIIFFLLTRYAPSYGCPTQGCTSLLHFDEPIANQYLDYMSGLAHFDFGTSTNGVSIGAEIGQRLPPTIILIGVAFVFQQLIALPLGILAALRRYSRLDQALTFISYLFLSTPPYVLGFFLIAIFWWNLRWLPPDRYANIVFPLIGSSDWWSLFWSNPWLVLGDVVQHLILPAFTLMATGIAIDSRFMRAAMLQVLHEDYIRTAKAKGVPRYLVIFKHAFRNALLPIVTNIGLYLPSLIGGVVVVETVFTWGGVGSLFGSAVGVRGLSGASFTPGADYPVLQALLLLSALAVLLANLLADIAYAWLDPRIRYEAGAEG